MVSACSARPGGDQEKPSTGRSHTRSLPTPRLPVPPQPRQPPQPLHSLKTSPAAVGRSAAKSRSDPIARDWFLDLLDQWKRERRWDMQRCLCEVQRLWPGDVRRDQPKHSLSLEAERGTSRDAQQEKQADTRRHDAAERARRASDRRPVLQAR